ncbi:hypothetical protein BN59_01162 [Legionella massiliensis]|uniref:Uncharacterized protein n=1 Tax=Legionella massiliensis TaxID=1034943 RepID=A0A078KYT8_9GAMM|nr:hypothetical protein [Legionella massiliensis]CDZ76883.1 hypothetical protein BN59_01162 [Legionella massiliensis]CEE12621.1 hypothetical protein BN1094_01162 [Legionella massiliensis]
MKFKVRPYEEVVGSNVTEDGFKDIIATLRGKHDAVVVNELNQPRRHQVQLIQKTQDLIVEHENRDNIITAMLLLEMCIIAKSYGESIFDAVKPNSATINGSYMLESGSNYFRGMLRVIGVTEDNPLEPEDVEELLTIARKFITYNICVNGDSAQGFKYKDETQKGKEEDHPFAEIAALDITEYSRTCVDVIHESAIKAITRNYDDRIKNVQSVEKGKQERAKAEREAEAEKLRLEREAEAERLKKEREAEAERLAKVKGPNSGGILSYFWGASSANPGASSDQANLNSQPNGLTGPTDNAEQGEHRETEGMNP